MSLFVRTLLVAVLALWASACGPELTGGSQTGEAEAVMTDEPESGGASASRSAGPSMSRSASSAEQAVELEGSLSADASVALLTASQQVVPITSGTVTGTVGIGSPDRDQLAKTRVLVDVYTGVRLVFTRVEAQLTAGLPLPGGGVGPLEIEVGLGGTPLVLDVPVDVAIRRDELTRVVVDLNSAIWLALADPATGVVAKEAFASAVRVRVEEE